MCQNKVNIGVCPICGLVYTNPDSNSCWINACGTVLGNFPENSFAVIADALKCRGYSVNRFLFPGGDKAPVIGIELSGHCDFLGNPPPDGFSCVHGTSVAEYDNSRHAERLDEYKVPVTIVYKCYPVSMPLRECAKQTLHDKSALIEWAYGFPWFADYQKH